MHFFFINIFYAQDKIVEYVKKTNKYGIKDAVSKKWLTLPVFDKINTITQNLNGVIKTLYFVTEKNSQKQIISKNGFEKISPVFNEIIVLSSNPNLCIIKKQNEYHFFEIGIGIITSLGSFSEFSKVNAENYFSAKDNFLIIKKEKKYYLFQSGIKKLSLECYDQISEAGYIHNSEIMEMLFNVKKTKWGIVNFDGKEIIPAEYDSLNISTFSNNDVITKKNNKFGLCDITGKKLLDNKYENIDPSIPKIIINNLNDSIHLLKKERNFLPLKFNGKWGILNVDSLENPIIPYNYDSICYVDLKKKLLLVIKEKKMGFIDFINNTVFPFYFNGFLRMDDRVENESKKKLCGA